MKKNIEYDYKKSWNKLNDCVRQKLERAKALDEQDAYNGAYGGRSTIYEDFRKLMKECLVEQEHATVSANEEDDRK